MRLRFILLIALNVLLTKSYGSSDNHLFGGRAAGMGNAAVTLYDFWAVSHNQAGLARIDRPAAGVYFENRFMAEELSLGAGAFVLPTKSGIFGLSFNIFGFELYNETKVGLAYARTFGQRLSAGLQLNYNNTFIANDYGSAGNLTFEAGIIFEIIPQLNIGVHVFNPTATIISDYTDDRIATVIRAGASWKFSEKVFVIIETEKSGNHDPVFRSGIEYHITDPIYIRAGIGTKPTTNSFGFGLALGRLNMDIAASYHHVLGYSPQIGFVYQF